MPDRWGHSGIRKPYNLGEHGPHPPQSPSTDLEASPRPEIETAFLDVFCRWERSEENPLRMARLNKG